MSRRPEVSIGVPVYNAERFLACALDSLVEQDFEDLEIVISDNASTDSTPDICRDYASRDTRVRYHRSETNIGAAPNFNRVFELSTGRYFKWAPHDDWVDRRFLSRCLEVLTAEADVVLCHPRTAIVDEESRLIREDLHHLEVTADRPDQRFLEMLWGLGRVNPMYGLIRSDALAVIRRHGTYLDAARVLLADLALQGKVREIPDVLLFIRHMPSSHKGKGSKAKYMATAWHGRAQVRSWELIRHHIGILWASPVLTTPQRIRLSGHVVARYAVKDARRFSVELAQAARSTLRG